MILSRARDALQTPADTRFQWKGQGRGLKNTHKSHFAFPRLPEVVKIKGMHGTPDRTAWTSPSDGEKKRKVLLPEQAWRPQTITAELDSSLPRHWTRLERPWTTVGQPNLAKQAQGQSFEGPWWLKAGRRAGFEGLRQTSHSAGHWRFLPPFFFCGCWCNFFHRPLKLALPKTFYLFPRQVESVDK